MTTNHPNPLRETPGTAGDTGAHGSAAAAAAHEHGRGTERVREEIDRRVGEARDAAVAAQDRARDAMERGSAEAAHFVRENPGAALAGALGIGVLIGLALGSSRR